MTHSPHGQGRRQDASLDELRRLRHARDLIDRDYDAPLRVDSLASSAFMAPAHFARRFKLAFGETPHAYLMTRRLERAAFYLRAGLTVMEVAELVGWRSLGSFSSRFVEVYGESPSSYRQAHLGGFDGLSTCQTMLTSRPRREKSVSEK